MKSIFLFLMLISSSFAGELYFDIGQFSDTSPKTKHQLFKISGLDLNKNDSYSCEFMESAHDVYSLNIILMDNVYLMNIDHFMGAEESVDSFVTAKDMKDLILVESSTDGYVGESIMAASREKLEELNTIVPMLDDSPIDLSAAVNLNVKDNKKVMIHGREYDFSCELENEDGF